MTDRHTTPSFIAELAQRVLAENAGNLREATVIFPNRRAGLFFRRELGRLIKKPVLMPGVYSMEDYLLSLSPLQKIEPLEAVFELHKVYSDLQNKPVPIDTFFFWGEMILRDFEEVDHYLADARHLFRTIRSQKELDEAFFFLEEEEKAIIRSFWTTFLPESTPSQQLFLETWKILLPLYERFTRHLASQGLGYGGMIYRRLAETMGQSGTIGRGRLYFAGFNALTGSEEKIIKYCVSERGAQVVWDLDHYYFADKRQEAGAFLRQYAADPVLGPSFPTDVPSAISRPKRITATGVSLAVGQAKAMGGDLRQAAQTEGFDPARTVVVLAQEHLLFPALHAIPDAIDKVNITMGYPLSATSVYSLLESALELHCLKKEDPENGLRFYYRPVQQVLLHPLIFPIEEQQIAALTAAIKKRNRISLFREDLNFRSDVLQALFFEADNPVTFLTTLLSRLYAYWKGKGRELELELVSRFYDRIAQVEKMIGQGDRAPGFDFFLRLFRKIGHSLKVPFTGEPLDGLQLMGILETRNLDFDRVFILNMNEDSWPAPSRKGSFIPFNIKKAFGLPVYESNDAIYAYLFYRLLQRAEEVHFYYNTVSEFNMNGELSRLVKQLEAESGHTITKRILSNPVKTRPADPITVTKTRAVQLKMERFLAGYQGRDASKLTASAINAYLDCRLRFYFKYIAKLYEPDEVKEEPDAGVFGNMLHNGMEILYGEFLKKEKREAIYPQDFFLIKEGVAGALRRAFTAHYHLNPNAKFRPEGRALIAFEVLKKMMSRILNIDEAYAPFRIIGLEAGAQAGFYHELPVPVGQGHVHVRLHGIIDRLDEKAGKVRIVDYKTGKDDKAFLSPESLTDRDHPRRNKAVFQVFLYSYLYWKKFGADKVIEPNLFTGNDLFERDFDPRIIKKDRRSSAAVSDFRALAGDYEELLTQLLTEIFHPEVPFDQTADEKKCIYCPYKEICSR